jgi:hypothetical protein
MKKVTVLTLIIVILFVIVGFSYAAEEPVKASVPTELQLLQAEQDRDIANYSLNLYRQKELVEIIQQRANRIKELKTPAKKEELIKK